MKKNTIVSIEQDVVKDIKANRKKRIKGSLFVNSDGHVDFDAEKKGGSGSDCETIFETNCGRLYMSECSIFIKSRGKKRLGRSRCADVLESDLCVLLEQGGRYVLLSRKYERSLCGEMPQGGLLEVHTEEQHSLAD